ncbi:hypothetical protein MFFC18_26290 [Mariniblastus fucicola]|uniref:Uncharacterized protein n=2 Tax=Mariniblastus fucicola TaxID=980251 RepID=A0A5B9PDU8_9BACT|nr:hypothetical protein MFFC18_26290 [Mariniblastus fucicola]
MVIPAVSAAPVSSAMAASSSSKPVDPMEDLLREANVGPVSSGGPICPDCGTEITPGAVLCVECGFNLETGKRLRTARENAEGEVDTGLTDAEKIMRKAEAEIEETPIGADDQDFGDGGDSFVIAGVAGVILAILVAIGLVVIFSMDQISLYYNSGGISFIASCCMWIGMTIWLTYVAFRAKIGHGIACVLTGGLYCIIFGFMQGKTLLMPTIIMLVALVVGLASGTYVYYCGFGPLET